MHERLNHMKETLMCAVEMQLCDLNTVDTKELGEAIDMIKDLEEAIYYCTVTEAMNAPQTYEKEWRMQENGHHQEYGDSRMYYDRKMPVDSRTHNSDPHMNADSDHMSGERGHRTDSSEGRSHMSRRMYMEAKHSHQDKSIQLRELEKYMQELSQDIVEMIDDASLEEKQYLEKKISALATKVGSMK